MISHPPYLPLTNEVMVERKKEGIGQVLSSRFKYHCVVYLGSDLDDLSESDRALVYIASTVSNLGRSNAGRSNA